MTVVDEDESSTSVITITQHRLTRLIDTYPFLARAEMQSLQLCSEQKDAKSQFFLLLELHRNDSKSKGTVWLRLEQTSTRSLSLLAQSRGSIIRLVSAILKYLILLQLTL